MTEHLNIKNVIFHISRGKSEEKQHANNSMDAGNNHLIEDKVS